MSASENTAVTPVQGPRAPGPDPRARGRGGAIDAIILGGGPAGSAAAIELARAGRRIALLERTPHAHHKVCGDFLSAEALSSLEALGLNPALLGATPIDRVRFAGPFGVSSTRLPFKAQSLTRRTLDDALLQQASAAGALVLRGHTAESLHRTGKLWSVAISGPTRAYTLTAPHVLLATGKHDLRGLPRPAGTHSGLLGLKMYLRLTPAQTDALRETIELVLLRGGYGGLSLVEDDVANLCFVLERDRLRDLGRDWPSLHSVLTRNPHLRTRLFGSSPLLSRPLAISPIPYGLLRRHPLAEDLYALGDQAAVIPSFTGDGLALALHTGRLTAHRLLAGCSSHQLHAELHTQLRAQISFATTLSRALVREPHRSALSLATRAFPGLLRAVASRTRLAPAHRIPDSVGSSRENPCTAA